MNPGRISSLLVLLAAIARAEEPAPTVFAIRGATVHTMSGDDIENASIVVRDGKIAQVGAGIELPPQSTIIEGAGLHLYPGFIDADTSLGLIEIPTVSGTVDTTETGRINPDVRAEVAVNPGSHLIGLARAGGVTSVLTVPEGELLAGAAALMNLQGWTWEEMLLKPRVALALRFPRLPAPDAKKGVEERKKDRDKKLKELNRIFDDAEAYLKARQAPGAGEPVAEDRRLEALLPVLRGETPLLVEANDLPTIKSAVDWAEKRKLRIILRGGADAGRWAEELAKRKIPVILGETSNLPTRVDEPYDTSFTLPARLQAAGVQFCITANEDASLIMNLQHQAGMAAAFGLDPKTALRAITLFPAQILGVADRIGSIEVGKDANLILTDGDPLEVRTRVVGEWIGGRPVDLRNHQSELYELYRSRPKAP